MITKLSAIRRKKVFLPVVFAVLLLLAWSGYWFVAANVVKNKAHQQAELLQKKGYDVSFSDLGVSGWPYRFVLTASNLQITQAKGAMPASAEALGLVTSLLRVHAMAWNLSHLIIEVPQPVRILAPQGEELIYSAQLTRSSLVFADGDLARLSLEIKEPVLQTIAGETLLSANMLEAHLRAGTDKDSRMIFALARVPVWPEMPISPLDEFKLQAEVFLWSSLREQGLQAFRAPDGRLKINQALMVSGKSSAEITGSVQVDEAGYLRGPVKVRFVSPADFLAALNTDNITDEARNTVLAISLLIGGVKETELSFKLRKGGLYMGPMRVGDSVQVLQ